MRINTKLSFIAFMIISGIQLSNAQQPTVPAPTPKYPSANVKSIYCNTYQNITPITKFLYWGGETTVSALIAPFGTTDSIMQFTNLNTIRIQCDKAVDISDMDSLHIDGYLAQKYSESKLYLGTLVTGANSITASVPKKMASSNGNPIGSWISQNIPIQYFKDNGQDCKNINFLMFIGKVEVYIDNIYAFKSSPSAVNVVNDNQSLKFYPTAVTDNLNFESSENLKKICLYNTVGQLVAVFSVNSEKSTINMSSFRSGSYIISAQGISGKITTKHITKL